MQFRARLHTLSQDWTLPLNSVTLTGTLPGAPGAVATFTPSNWLTDPTDHELIPPVPVQVLLSKTGTFSVSLLATDNGAPLPSGWTWTVVITGIPGVTAYSFSFFLPFANGATQDISTLAPVVPAGTVIPASCRLLSMFLPHPGPRPPTRPMSLLP